MPLNNLYSGILDENFSRNNIKSINRPKVLNKNFTQTEHTNNIKYQEFINCEKIDPNWLSQWDTLDHIEKASLSQWE
jgi:hypothetical protein